MTTGRRTHVLYRAYDENFALLYVGITANPGVRLRKHSEQKWWWGNVSQIQMQHFNSRDALEAAERKAIASESPVFNVQGNQGHRETFLEWYDDSDPDDDEAGDTWVMEEYAPAPERTASECEEARRSAELMGRILFPEGASA